MTEKMKTVSHRIELEFSNEVYEELMTRVGIRGMTGGLYSSSPLDEVVILILEAMKKGKKELRITKKKGSK